MAPSGGQICKWRHVVAKFSSSLGVNFWVRCASGNVCLDRHLEKLELTHAHLTNPAQEWRGEGEGGADAEGKLAQGEGDQVEQLALDGRERDVHVET